MPLQLRRGSNADRLTTTFAEGEPVWTTDTTKLYVGDGVTAGGVEISGGNTFDTINVTNTATVGSLATSGNIDGTEGFTANMTGFRAGLYGGTAGFAFKADTDTGMFAWGAGDLRFKNNNVDTAIANTDLWTFNQSISVQNTATVATLKFGDGTTMTTAASGSGSTSTYYNLTVTNILAVGDPAGSQLKIFKDGSVIRVGSGGNSMRVEDTNYLYLNPNSGVIINETDPAQSFLNVNTIRPSGNYTAVTVASTLTVTGNATANSIVTQDLVSSGGFPLDSNGMALIRVSNTQTPAMIASNYTAGLLPEVVVRGYGQNRPGGPTATTNGAPAVILESSRGTHTAPTTVSAGDVIGTFSVGAYNGTRWSSDVNLYSAELIATAAGATWAGNATTTTNAGSRFFMRIQPPNVQLNTTSRVTPYAQTWTGVASTATGSPPILTISEGSGIDGNPTLIPTGGVGSLSTGHGRVNLVKINTQHQIFGVPSQDTGADNPTLPGTNSINFISGRRSGNGGR